MEQSHSLLYRYLTLATLLGAVAWCAAAPGWEPGVVLLGTLAAFIAIERPARHIPRLNGRWEYEVVRRIRGSATRATAIFSRMARLFASREFGDSVVIERLVTHAQK